MLERDEQCLGSVSANDDTTGDEEDESTLLTVRFKCIGATRDQNHQNFLEENELLQAGKEVKVALFPKSTNPVDAKAVAFKYRPML